MTAHQPAVEQETHHTQPAATRPGRIARSEWPTILDRHENGESASAIARDYGVTGPAIHYILKKARAEKVDRGAGAAPAAAPPSPEAEVEDLAEPAEAAQPEPAAPSPGNGLTHPLANRLAETSRECCLAIEAFFRDRQDPDAVKEALHQVRRALAAVDIEMGKQPRAVPESTGPAGVEITGTVKFFNAQKGFGFIVADDGSRDIFVDMDALIRSGLTTLEPRQRVRLTTVMGAKGPQADTIEIA